jgi:hypothetical protein
MLTLNISELVRLDGMCLLDKEDEDDSLTETREVSNEAFVSAHRLCKNLPNEKNLMPINTTKYHEDVDHLKRA